MYGRSRGSYHWSAKLRARRHQRRHARVTGPLRRVILATRLGRRHHWAMTIQLVTFGGLHVADDSGELDWLLAQHSRAALFVYLAVERRVSRESLTAVFWPESDAENARHALRQSLYQLRKAVGTDWLDSRPHELVVTGDVRTDTTDFAQLIERGDVESAARLYRGPFLDGVHLVDLKPWENWVDARRAQHARAFRKVCRELLEARRVAGDPAGAVAAAEWWTERDPLDDEAQHRLIEALAAAGERAEAIRQYETYARLLEPDGLQPPAETQALADRLRSDTVALPALRTTSPALSPESQRHHATSVSPFDQPLPVRPSASARPTRRWSPQLLAAGVILLLLVADRGPPRLQRGSSAQASSTTIVVLPFAVRGGTAAQYLEDGIVNLLGAALDGAGSLRPVDTRATFGAISEGHRIEANPPRAEQVARRLGAGLFVLGDVVEGGGQLQIEGAVYRVGAGCAKSGSAIIAATGCPPPESSARAVVQGAADSVFSLVDRLAARLLGGLGDPAADRLLRTAALTTASLPAFKSYLQGEELMRAGEFERAADAYLAAIAEDSTFAVAHYRLALAREWAPLPGEGVAASAAARYGERLSAHDRSFLEAFRQWRAGDATEAERSYRAILARYPEFRPLVEQARTGLARMSRATGR